MRLIDIFGLGKASFKDIYLFLSQDSKFYSSDTRGRVSLPDCSMSYSISSTFLSNFCSIFWPRWHGHVISGSYHEVIVGIETDNTLLILRMRLRMASLLPFKMTLVTKWVLCTPHMVQLSLDPNPTY